MQSDLVDEVTLLAQACELFVRAKGGVWTPSDGEAVELAVGHAAYSVRLIDTPYLTKEEREVSDRGPMPKEPLEIKLGNCAVSLIDCIATGQKVAADGSIVLAPRLSSTSHGAIYLSDGEVLLTDLRAELIAQGLKAEYSASTGYSQLVVNGKIIVKKAQNSGRVNVEGPLCEDFYTVQAILYSQYIVL
jgi:cleavage and polyadenylation specificity factor subunit 2